MIEFLGHFRKNLKKKSRVRLSLEIIMVRSVWIKNGPHLYFLNSLSILVAYSLKGNGSCPSSYL
jgi:hypothetical protein